MIAKKYADLLMQHNSIKVTNKEDLTMLFEELQKRGCLWCSGTRISKEDVETNWNFNNFNNKTVVIHNFKDRKGFSHCTFYGDKRCKRECLAQDLCPGSEKLIYFEHKTSNTVW